MSYFIHRTPTEILYDTNPVDADSLWNMGPIDNRAETKDLVMLLTQYYQTQPYQTQPTDRVRPATVCNEIFERLGGVEPIDKTPYLNEIMLKCGSSRESARMSLYSRFHRPNTPWGGQRANSGRKKKTPG